MLLGAEIAMAVIGILAMARGRMPLTERKAVLGSKARLLGLVAMLPGLFALTAFLVVRGSARPVELSWLWMAQLGVILACAALVYALGLRWASVIRS